MTTTRSATTPPRRPSARTARRPRRTPTTRSPPPARPTIGVPNFFIEKFRIPPFLLPIYQAAGIQYGIRWEVLAAINEIETDYGRNLNISSAGALGWMQFMPATWDAYGVDANGDGEKDPFNPVDAIFAAARYLRAAGADKDLYRAIFAYNHADWYVESVLMRARVIGGLPADLVGSLTGLTQGRFPVQAKATYAGALPDAEREERFEPGQNAATSSSPTARAARSASSAASARRSSPSTTAASPHRPLAQARPLRRAPGHLRQHLPLLRARARSPRPTRSRRSARAQARDLALPEGDVAPRRAASVDEVRSRGRRRRARRAPSSAKRPQRVAAQGLRGAAAGQGAPVRAPRAPERKAAGGDEQLATGAEPTR